MPESKTSHRRLVAAERQRQALALRISGASFEQIAEALSFKDRSGAYRAVMAALARVPEPEAKTYRAINVERLNTMRLQYWQRVRAGDLEAMNMELKTQGLEMRYLGLEVKDPVPGSSREHPLWTQPVDAVDLSAATGAEIDEIIEKAKAIQEADRITKAATARSSASR